MRLFIAVPIPEEVRATLTQVQARLVPLATQTGVRVKWVEPENFHLTVAFLGELSENTVADIEDACRAIAAETQPFRVGVAGVSIFPKPRARGPVDVKTIWVGLSDGLDPWQGLIGRAEPWFVPFGAARDGGLVPHITLGRVKTERTGSTGDKAAFRSQLETEADTVCGEMVADRLVLIESVLDPRGATYREINEYAFGRTPETETI